MEPCERPSAFFPSGPFNTWPFTIVFFQMKSLGNNMDIHWRPVHRSGAVCVGGGITKSSIHMAIMHISDLSNKTSGCVNK